MCRFQSVSVIDFGQYETPRSGRIARLIRPFTVPKSRPRKSLIEVETDTRSLLSEKESDWGTVKF
jgi:hypothetical protein